MGDKLSVNPWVGMWLRPRETIRAIIEYNPTNLLAFLSFIYGFPLLLQIAQNLFLGDRFSVTMILVGALIGATFMGLIAIHAIAGLLYWTGKWIGGIGTFQTIRAAVAWSSIPNVVVVLIWLVNIGMFGTTLFQQAFMETPFVGATLTWVFFLSLLQVVVAVWGLVMLLKAVGEVQGFSAWKAILNILIPFFIVFIGISILGWIISMATSV